MKKVARIMITEKETERRRFGFRLQYNLIVLLTFNYTIVCPDNKLITQYPPEKVRRY